MYINTTSLDTGFLKSVHLNYSSDFNVPMRARRCHSPSSHKDMANTLHHWGLQIELSSLILQSPCQPQLRTMRELSSDTGEEWYDMHHKLGEQTRENLTQCGFFTWPGGCMQLKGRRFPCGQRKTWWQLVNSLTGVWVCAVMCLLSMSPRLHKKPHH